MQSIPFFHMPHKRAAQKGAAAKGPAQGAAQASSGRRQQQQKQQELLRSQQATTQPQKRPNGMRSRQEVTVGHQLLDSTLSGMGSADNMLEGAAGLGGMPRAARGSSVRTQSMPVRQKSPMQQDFQPLLAGVHASPGLQRDMASTGSMYCFETAGAPQSAFSRQQAHQRMLQTLPCPDMSGLAPGILPLGTW
eukprot:jgi/Astpho2/1481/Aster-05367